MDRTPLFDAVLHHANVRADAVAFTNLASNQSQTWSSTADRVGRLATVIRDHGVERQDRVALLAENNANVLEAQFACGWVGAILLPLNWRLSLPELHYVVDDAMPSMIITDSMHAERADELSEYAGGLPVIAWDALDASTSEYEQAVVAASWSGPDRVHHDDIQMVMYTSGTTGKPKGAKLTFGMTVWNTFNMTELFEFTPDMVNLGVLPLFHIGGLNGFANPAAHSGGMSVIARSFDPGQTLAALSSDELAVTHFQGVPTMYSMMADHPDFERSEMATLRFALIAGAPAPPALLARYATRDVILQQGYGLTEAGPMVLGLTRADARSRAGSVGKPLLNIDTRVVRPDGQDAEAGQTGELWVRGPTVTPGYWNREPAGTDTFVDDWFRTGDAVRRDADGYHYVVDRYKDMYISGGENVYPAEIEAVIYDLPAVAEAVVVGVEDDRWGESGLALVVPTGNPSDLTPEVVLDHCRSNLAKYKVPKQIRIVDDLPHTATGKVQRAAARSRYA